MTEDHVGAGISYAVTELRFTTRRRNDSSLSDLNRVSDIINLFGDEMYLLRIMEQISGFQDSFQKCG